MAVVSSDDQLVQWGPEMEVMLFYAMRKHKPVGINKHFHMMCIYEKLVTSATVKISSKQIWDHLETMYDMAALHESEVIPFPNVQQNFDLPENEFGDLKKTKSSEKTNVQEDDKKEVKGKATPSGVTSSDKDGAKRKRTRQSAGTPSEAPTSKRRR
ncbi:MRG/MORF4L-binding protein-like [Apostichopus japonicus]|uniref:MRG/MORF4L-binding protein-like n=1 Tax=Stichopus japonicus TaxID=307972 RepID=UPI003AB32F8C